MDSYKASTQTKATPSSKSTAAMTSSSQQQHSFLSSLPDTLTRFFLLYFTTLFSFDTVAAAQNSPYRVSGARISDGVLQARQRREFRLDPGGDGSRRMGGFDRRRDDGGASGGGRDLDIPANRFCPLNATPSVS